MRHNPLADALSVMKNAENAGKKECMLTIESNMLKSVLSIMKTKGYVGDFSVVDKIEGGKIKVMLKGHINDCKAILPQFTVKKDEYEKWEKRYLPAVNVGTLIVSTSTGVKSHEEVKGKIGGKLIAFVY
ncbi:MAG: 30S ribosomal protein S8 [Candidatus Aenigmarchaeota archaeon]|nr:30S ribosomal protein S8 [Candidatus Aenigmarchaeota archaeon]